MALPATHHAQILGIIDSCREYGVDFKLVPDLFEMRFNEVRIDALNGVPLIGVKDVALRGFNLVVKRAIDIAAGDGWACSLAAADRSVVMVKATSPGPGALQAEARGQGRSDLHLLQVPLDVPRRRAEAGGAKAPERGGRGVIFKMRNDPRLTRVGQVPAAHLAGRVAPDVQHLEGRDELGRPAPAHARRGRAVQRVAPQAPRRDPRPHGPVAGERPVGLSRSTRW